jgi:excisionase family DNA binding protein
MPGMSNNTISPKISTWSEARATDREVLNREEVAALLTIDPRTVDKAIENGELQAIRFGRRILIPRRPFLEKFGVGLDVAE